MDNKNKLATNSCFISAGEVSADIIGEDLVRRLKDRFPQMELYGIGGERMIEAGLWSIVDQKQLRFMGFWDAICNLSKIKKVLDTVIKTIEQKGTRFVVLIDYPGFHFKLASELKKRGIKVFQYISPKVWAWGSWRIKKMQRCFDAVFGVFPFEIDYFKDTGVNYIYVGSFHKKRIDSFLKKEEGSLPLFDFSQDKFKYSVACLPGSRRTEFKENFYIMQKILSGVRKKISARIIIPIASGFLLEDLLAYLPKEVVSGLNLSTIDTNRDDIKVIGDKDRGVYFVYGNSLLVLKQSDSALVVEGTATLETALIKTPFASIYNPGWLMTFLGKRLIKTPFIGLDNIVRGKLITKEFIKYFTEEEVEEEIIRLTTDSEYRQWMKLEFEKLADIFDTKSTDIVEAISCLID